MLTKGEQMLRRAPPSVHHLMEGRQVTQVMQFMTWRMMWLCWRKDYHRWALLPRCPSDSCNPANHHLTDLYHPSIDKIIQHMKNRHTIASTSEWHWERGGDKPPFKCIEWFVDCWHVPGWSWRMKYRSCSPCPRRGNLILWMVITQRGAPLGKYQGCWIQLDRCS